MDPPAKRQRCENILIRLCDKFTRNELNIICPLIKAENSVRVLYQLQKETLEQVVQKAGEENGFKFQKCYWRTAPGGKKMEGSLFIEYTPSQETDENNCERLIEMLELELKEVLNGEYAVIDKVDDMTQTVPQPIISEFDLEVHKLKVLSKEVKEKYISDACTIADITEQVLEELNESYTKFAVLSQNGKGKSFILNLLLLMTADSQEEYCKNNKNLKLPKGFPDKVQWKTLTHAIPQSFPEAVKDFFKDKNNNTPPPVCYQLTCTKDPEESVKTFSNIGEYFSKSIRLDLDPFVLAQKDSAGAHESTTKCILQLRYGTCYQLKVEYFSKEELQQQLYELFTSDRDPSQVKEEVKEKAEECLKARFEILTGHKPDEVEHISTYDDINLSKEVLEFAGKTELYIGRGTNSTYDRLALQDVLRELTTAQEEDDYKAEATKKKIAAVKEILVYLPSKILYGGKEILEMPGIDDSDPIAMFSIRNVLSEVDAVILVTEYGFKISEKGVKDMLSESGFLKRLKTDPSSNKLMLITYPEKNSKWQFSCEGKNKIEKLEKESEKKREAELKMVSNILEKPLVEFGHNIFTSYLLPVLHSSILSQMDLKPEYEVIKNYGAFLKHTGITDLLIHLDEWVLSKQKSSLEQVKTQAENTIRMIMNPSMQKESARAILQQLSSKEFQPKHDRFSEMLNTLNIRLLGNDDKRVEHVLEEYVPHAKKQWNAEKDKVTSIAVYNPRFIGKNPKYQVRLFHIFFRGFEDTEESLYNEILQKINDCFEQYENDVIKFYHTNLKTFLKPMKFSVSKDFVTKVVNEKLISAKQRYLGNVKRSFSKKTFGKFMEESKKISLKSVILEKNYQHGSIEEAKERTEADIEDCLMRVAGSFMEKLSDLHKQRFNYFQNVLCLKNGDSKIWKELEKEIKRISRDKTEDSLSDVCNRLHAILATNLSEQEQEDAN